MTYLAWAVMYEGESDAAYYNVLLPRLMEDLVLAGTKLPTIPTAPAIRISRSTVDQVAQEACDASSAFHLLFIHADTGGRGVANGIADRSSAYADAMAACCGWPKVQCIGIAPGHETEAWILADPLAVTATLGYSGAANTIGLPNGAVEAERLQDPKATLREAIQQVRGRRKPVDLAQVFPAIAQRQRLDELRRAPSFRTFEANLKVALHLTHCL